MGTIFRNKVAYGGGSGGSGESFIELTQAEYDALPDSKYTDNKNYLIKDANSNNESVSSVDIGVRYNKETDMIQIYDGTEWIDWKSGGLTWDGSLYREGNTYSDITGGFSLYQLAGTGGGSYSLTFNTNDIKIGSSSSLGILSTNNTINFSEFTKLHIEGTINQTDGDSVEFTVGFGTSKNTTTASVYSLKGITGTKVISETIDISTHNANSLYIHIKFYATYNYKWLGNFTLTNLYFLP